MKSCRLFPALLLLLGLGNMVAAQDLEAVPPSRPLPIHSVQFELLGNGGRYSLNYEGIIFHSPYARAALRAGLGVWTTPFGTSDGIYPHLWAPLMVNGQFGHKSHWLQVGVGTHLTNMFQLPWQNIRIIRNGGRDLVGHATGEIGYRFQPIKRRLIFKLSYTPLYRLTRLDGFLEEEVPKWHHTGGLTVGYVLE